MPGNRHNRDQVLRRRAEVSELYLSQGLSMEEIAQRLQVSPQQVSHDMQRCRESWRSAANINVGEMAKRELARLDTVESQAWISWRKSAGLHKVERWEVSSDGTKRKVVTEERRIGDPAFLGLVTKCVEQRCKLLGLNAPPKVVVEGKLSIEQFREICEEADRIEAAEAERRKLSAAEGCTVPGEDEPTKIH